ncbi:hypothetical protein [Paenibacillus sp. GCM10027626]|uniref:hypothetical protein n=1 Tax=Paenibacillus sp. GCM10027626 TaxID=3273411 RepID=UPI00362DD915
MNKKDELEEQIATTLKKAVEHRHTSVTAEHLLGKKRSSEPRLRRLQLRPAYAALILLLVIVLPTAVYSYYTNGKIWGNQNFTITNTSIEDDNPGNSAVMEDPSKMVRGILHDLKQVDAEQVKQLSAYPLRRIEQWGEWKKTTSTGYVRWNDDGSGVTTDLPPSYIEIFENAAQEQLIVLQDTDEMSTQALQRLDKTTYAHAFSADWSFVEEFGADLAVMKQTASGWVHLMIYHQEDNNTVTRFELYGKDDGLLKEVAHRYLAAGAEGGTGDEAGGEAGGVNGGGT